MEATTERPKRNGVMRRSRLANPTCWPRSLRTSSSRTDWNLLAIVINCWGAIRPSFRSSKGFGGLDGSFQKSPEFQEVRSSKPGLDSLSPYLCCAIRRQQITRIPDGELSEKEITHAMPSESDSSQKNRYNTVRRQGKGSHGPCQK